MATHRFLSCSHRCALLLAAASVASPGAQAPPATYTTIDFPGAVFTAVMGINDRGDVAGNYRDAAGATHGFVRLGTRFVSIDYPGAVLSTARGVGPGGEVVGGYRLAGEPNVNLHGFIRSPEGGFSKADVPGHESTVAVRRLADGSIIGCFHDADQGSSMRGVRLAGDMAAAIGPASSMHLGATPDGRTLVGFFTDPDARRVRGYVLDGSTLAFSPFDVPDSRTTSAQDVNASGLIVGVYQDAEGRFHGFARQDGRYETLDVPGAAATRAFSVNSDGSIGGAYVDAAGVTHGFIRMRAANGSRTL